jgi:hypothetical protein
MSHNGNSGVADEADVQPAVPPLSGEYDGIHEGKPKIAGRQKNAIKSKRAAKGQLEMRLAGGAMPTHDGDFKLERPAMSPETTATDKYEKPRLWIQKKQASEAHPEEQVPKEICVSPIASAHSPHLKKLRERATKMLNEICCDPFDSPVEEHIDLIIECGADPLNPSPRTLHTSALHIACMRGHLDVITHLVNVHGVPVDLQVRASTSMMMRCRIGANIRCCAARFEPRPWFYATHGRCVFDGDLARSHSCGGRKDYSLPDQAWCRCKH